MKFIAALPVLFAFLVGALPAHAWTWPVEGPVLRPFNLGSDPYAAGQHRGIDVAAQSGAAVHAPASGLVSFAGSVPGNGKTLTISTADGYAVTLVHLGSIAVTRGTSVEGGATIGSIGPSGEPEHAEGYVHLGVRVASVPEGYVDPLSLLPARGAVEPGPANESGTSEPDRVPPVETTEGEPAPDAPSAPAGEGAAAPSPGASEPSPPPAVEAPAEPAPVPMPEPVEVPVAEIPPVEIPAGSQVEGGVPVGAPQAESEPPVEEQPAAVAPVDLPVAEIPPVEIPAGGQVDGGVPVGAPEAESGPPVEEQPAAVAPVEVPVAEIPPVEIPAGSQVDGAVPVGAPQAESGPPVEEQPAAVAPEPVGQPAETGLPAGEQPVESAPPADSQQEPTTQPGGEQVEGALPPVGQEAENTPPGSALPVEGTPPLFGGEFETPLPVGDQSASVPGPAGEGNPVAGTTSEPSTAPQALPAGVSETPAAEGSPSAPSDRGRAEAAEVDAAATRQIGIDTKAQPSSPRDDAPHPERAAPSLADNVAAAMPATPDASPSRASGRHREDYGWLRTAWPPAVAGALVLLLTALALRRRLSRIETAPHDPPPGMPTASAAPTESGADEEAAGPTALDAWLEALLSSQPRCAAASPPRIARAGQATCRSSLARRPVALRPRPQRSQVRDRTRKERALRA